MQQRGAVGPVAQICARQLSAGFALVAAQLALAHDQVIGVAALERRRDPGAGDRVRGVGDAHATRLEPAQARRAQAGARDRVQRRLAGQHSPTAEQTGTLGGEQAGARRGERPTLTLRQGLGGDGAEADRPAQDRQPFG